MNIKCVVAALPLVLSLSIPASVAARGQGRAQPRGIPDGRPRGRRSVLERRVHDRPGPKLVRRADVDLWKQRLAVAV